MQAEEIETSFSFSGKGKNMVAVASSKSGVGKTWFSITLAQALSIHKQKVLLFDGDLGLANIGAQLGLSVELGLDDVISGNKSLNQIIHSYDRGHFDIIVGKDGTAGLMSMPIGRLQILGEDLSSISSNYDKLILDIGSGIVESSRILSGMAKTILVLCTDEPSSITEAYAFIRTISEQYPKSKIRVVVNQANSEREGYRTYDLLQKACNSFLKKTPELLGIIRRDTRVRDSIRNQSTIINRYPTSEAATDVMNIVGRLLADG